MKTGESQVSSVQIEEVLLRYSLKCLKEEKATYYDDLHQEFQHVEIGINLTAFI
jgi:hypothetical protein